MRHWLDVQHRTRSKTMKKQLQTLAVLVALPSLLLGVSSPAQAQWSDSMGGSFNNPMSSTLSSQSWGNLQMQQNLNLQRMLRHSTQQRSQQARQPQDHAQSGGAPAVRPQSLATTIFTPVAPPLLPQPLAAQLGRTPAQRQQLAQLFTSCLQLYQQLEPQVRPAQARGEPIHDVARAAAYYITGNYYVYSQGQEPTGQQYEDVYTTIRAALRENKQFQALDNRQRQTVHEQLAIMTSLSLIQYQTAKQQKNQEQQEQARLFAAQNLERLGLSAARMQLTSDGLVMK